MASTRPITMDDAPVLAELLREQGAAFPCVVLDPAGAVAGAITLNSIIRGAFQSCSVGYWVSAACNGRGLATAALTEVVEVAFGELGLHRVQAEILPENAGSQRVLERNGFVRYGVAPDRCAPVRSPG